MRTFAFKCGGHWELKEFVPDRCNFSNQINSKAILAKRKYGLGRVLRNKEESMKLYRRQSLSISVVPPCKKILKSVEQTKT